jgi:uncharacterized FlaG/YvyC family protein
MRVEPTASLSATLQPTPQVRLAAEPSVKVQEVKRPSEANQSRTETDPQHKRQPPPEQAPVQSSGRLTIELDRGAGVFVQRLIDPSTEEVIRQFPHEGQLMLARAQKAYEKARGELAHSEPESPPR